MTRGKAWAGALQFTDAASDLQDRRSWRGLPPGRGRAPGPPVPGEELLQVAPVGHVGDGGAGGAGGVQQRQEHVGGVRAVPVDLLTRLLGQAAHEPLAAAKPEHTASAWLHLRAPRRAHGHELGGDPGTTGLAPRGLGTGAGGGREDRLGPGTGEAEDRTTACGQGVGMGRGARAGGSAEASGGWQEPTAPSGRKQRSSWAQRLSSHWPVPRGSPRLRSGGREGSGPLHTRGARARTLTWEPQSAPAAPSPAEASRPSEWSWRPRGPCGDREGLRGPPQGDRRPAARDGRAPETEPWASGGRVLDTARAAGGLSLAGGASSQRAKVEVAGSAPGGQAPAPMPAGTALASHGCRAPAPAPHGRTLSRAPAAAARCFLARATGHSE